VKLAHGGGGRLMHQLIDRIFRPAFRNPALDEGHDSAMLEIHGQRIAFTTDSYVVRPLFFPGGDIGKLAVCGTVNDLAMAGARPLYLSAGFVIEEGLPTETLERVADSMRQAAAAAGVVIATGDTKVVDRGKGDGLYLNTAGLGVMEHGLTIGPRAVQAGDAIVLSGDVGRHGTAILACREGLEFESTIQSDCANLSPLVQALLDAGLTPHCLRDLTRGGLATSLVEIAGTSGRHLHIRGGAVPVREDVRGACEILGLDPMYVANEGRFLVLLPADQAEKAVEILRGFADAETACVIGAVKEDGQSVVTMESEIGAIRILDMLSGEQLPRIC